MNSRKAKLISSHFLCSSVISLRVVKLVAWILTKPTQT